MEVKREQGEEPKSPSGLKGYTFAACLKGHGIENSLNVLQSAAASIF